MQKINVLGFLALIWSWNYALNYNWIWHF